MLYIYDTQDFGQQVSQSGHTLFYKRLLSSGVERVTSNDEVIGSNPVGGKFFCFFRAVESVFVGRTSNIEFWLNASACG